MQIKVIEGVCLLYMESNFVISVDIWWIWLQGAATTCYVALNPEVKGISGKYFSNSNLAKPSKQTQDVVLAQKLWDYTMDLITNHAH